VGLGKLAALWFSKKVAAFCAAFVLVKEFMFRIKEFWALFTGSRRCGSIGGIHSLVIGVIVVWCIVGGPTGVMSVARHITVFFGDVFILLSTCNTLSHLFTSLSHLQK